MSVSLLGLPIGVEHIGHQAPGLPRNHLSVGPGAFAYNPLNVRLNSLIVCIIK